MFEQFRGGLERHRALLRARQTKEKREHSFVGTNIPEEPRIFRSDEEPGHLVD